MRHFERYFLAQLLKMLECAFGMRMRRKKLINTMGVMRIGLKSYSSAQRL